MTLGFSIKKLFLARNRPAAITTLEPYSDVYFRDLKGAAVSPEAHPSSPTTLFNKNSPFSNFFQDPEVIASHTER